MKEQAEDKLAQEIVNEDNENDEEEIEEVKPKKVVK